jgi:hypothetical protein
MLRQALKIATFLLVTGVAAAARQTTIEYGQAGELRGVVKLFVSTDTDMKARESIVRELHKRLPQLKVTGRPEEADVHLVFRSERLHVPGALTWIGESAPTYGAAFRNGYEGVRTTVVASRLVPVVVGTGVVFKVVGPDRVRLLMSFRGESLPRSLERSPRTNFVREFVKQYKRANPPRPRGR